MSTDPKDDDSDDVEFHLPEAEAPERNEVGSYSYAEDATTVFPDVPPTPTEHEFNPSAAVNDEVIVLQDGPPPSDKVDFENLPEFVWQRKMLRTVRWIAVFVTTVIALLALVAFFGLGRDAKNALKSVIEGEPPAAPDPQP